MKTSERHTNLLNQMQNGETGFGEWTRKNVADLRVIEWSYGALKMEWVLDQNYVFGGAMFGGYIALVADHVLAGAAMTVLEESDMRFRTAQLETKFFRPLSGGRSIIEASAVNKSRNLIHVEANFLNENGKVAARSTAVQSRRREGQTTK
ncbi:MAG: PaaI family thioesterase [Pseudomonadota bacterium]